MIQKSTITRKQYKLAKTQLIRKEQQNADHIYIIYCAGNKGWCEAGDRSAMYYYFEVAKRFGLTNKFKVDSTEYNTPYKIGYVRIPNLDVVRNYLKEAELYKSEGCDSEQTFYFELKKPYSKSEIEAYETKIKHELLQNLTIAPAENLSPEFYQLTVNLGRRIISVCNSQLDRLTRDTVGFGIVNAITKSIDQYHRITKLDKKSKIVVKERWQEIRRNIYDVIFNFKVLSDIGAISSKDAVNIVEGLDRIRAIVEKEILCLERAIKRAEKAKQNKQNKQNKSAKQLSFQLENN